MSHLPNENCRLSIAENSQTGLASESDRIEWADDEHYGRW